LLWGEGGEPFTVFCEQIARFFIEDRMGQLEGLILAAIADGFEANVSVASIAMLQKLLQAVDHAAHEVEHFLLREQLFGPQTRVDQLEEVGSQRIHEEKGVSSVELCLDEGRVLDPLDVPSFEHVLPFDLNGGVVSLG
jgi:hypothetical protein